MDDIDYFTARKALLKSLATLDEAARRIRNDGLANDIATIAGAMRGHLVVQRGPSVCVTDQRQSAQILPFEPVREKPWVPSDSELEIIDMLAVDDPEHDRRGRAIDTFFHTLRDRAARHAVEGAL